MELLEYCFFEEPIIVLLVAFFLMAGLVALFGVWMPERSTMPVKPHSARTLRYIRFSQYAIWTVLVVLGVSAAIFRV